MNGKTLYVVAKVFDEQGCLAYPCKDAREARCLPGVLDSIRTKGVEIIILDSPDLYAEYAPYRYVDDMKRFICLVYELNRDAIGCSEQIVRADAVRAMISSINRTYGFRTEDAARYAKAISWSIDWVIGYEEGARRMENFLAALCAWAREQYGAEKAVDIIVDKTERKKYQPIFEKTPEYAALMAGEN